MKKILLLILTLGIACTIASCKNSSSSSNSIYKEENQVTFLMPAGAPAISQIYIQQNKESYNYKIDVVQGSDPLSAAFVSKSYDFIYAPLNLGAKMYINNQNYKLLALIVSCNYYFVTSTTEEFTLSDLSEKEIVIFGQNAPSGILARLILTSNNLTDLNITYVNSVADSTNELVLDNSKVVLTAEPSLSSLEGKVNNLKTISIADEYAKINSSFKMPQAALFVRSDIDSAVANRYLTYIEDSINKVTTSIDESAELGATLYPSFTKEALINAIPRCELDFVKSTEASSRCEAFFEILNNVNPNIIGGTVDENFYY